jgi:hypothetical protein
MAVRLSALHASRHLPPGRFMVLISVRGWVDPRGIVLLEGLGQWKNDIGNRNRNLPACSIVPQITLPRAPPPITDNTTINLAHREERNECKYYIPTNRTVVACWKQRLHILLGVILAVIANNLNFKDWGSHCLHTKHNREFPVKFGRMCFTSV